jgi:hypothetical protein
MSMCSVTSACIAGNPSLPSERIAGNPSAYLQDVLSLSATQHSRQEPIEDWLDEWYEGEMDGLVRGTAIPKPAPKKRASQPKKKVKMASQKKRLHSEL